MAEIGWGQLADNEGVGTPFVISEEFKELTFEEAVSEKYTNYKHAAHGMIYTKLQGKLWDLYPKHATALMQVRFDGFLGFPGGLVDENETSVSFALNREFKEEIDLNLDKFSFKQENHIVSHVNESIKLITHFYAFEVTEKDFCQIEKDTLGAPEWGIETFGIIRVPMFTIGDGYRGFPVFLANKFAGNAKQQLIITMRRQKILETSVLDTVLDAAEKYQKHTN